MSIRNRIMIKFHKIEMQKLSANFCFMLICIVLVSIAYTYCVYAQGWLTYMDPNGKYTLQFPPDLNPSIPDSEENGPLVMNFVSRDRPSTVQMIISVVSSDKNLNLTLDNLKDLSMAVNSQSLPTFHILDEPNYTKYKIDNNPAVSYTFGYGMSEKTEELYVGSKINSTIFHIGYAAPEELQFDFYLPTIEKVINSIKLVKTN